MARTHATNTAQRTEHAREHSSQYRINVLVSTVRCLRFSLASLLMLLLVALLTDISRLAAR